MLQFIYKLTKFFIMGYGINMKILSIGLINPSGKTSKINKTTANCNNITVTKPYAPDSVSFGRVAENAEKMRALFKYGMIDVHTGKYIIDPEFLENALKNGLFERPIQTVVKVLKPVERCLHDVEAELFRKIEEMSKTHPLYRLNDVIQKLAPAAQERLLNLQRPIFKDLKDICVKLPAEQKQAFDDLMAKTELQLENKPISYKFSKKEFRYQLERIAQDIKRRGITDEIKTVDKMLGMSQRMPYTPSGRNFSRRKPKFNPEKQLSQANMIRQLENFLARSVLREDKGLNDLIQNAKMQVFNIKMVIPFKRKTFNHELSTITDTLKDRKLANEIIKKASELPTAQEELSAFIMKSSRYSSTKIGHDLLYGSAGTIDHLVPYSHGGADSIENYAYTTNALNSRRGNKTIERWLKENPQTREGSQKCVDRLLELYREGVFEKEGLTPWYILHFARRMKKLSPKDNPIELDLGTLPKELARK